MDMRNTQSFLSNWRVPSHLNFSLYHGDNNCGSFVAVSCFLIITSCGSRVSFLTARLKWPGPTCKKVSRIGLMSTDGDWGWIGMEDLLSIDVKIAMEDTVHWIVQGALRHQKCLNKQLAVGTALPQTPNCALYLQKRLIFWLVSDPLMDKEFPQKLD